MRILVTGGAGYIGSHTVLLLLEAGGTKLMYWTICPIRHENRWPGSQNWLVELPRFTWPDLLDTDSLEKAFCLGETRCGRFTLQGSKP